MAELSVMARSNVDTAIGGFLERQERRVATMPPGTCPVAAQLDLLRAGAVQTCGKCVPCRDGLPQLARMLEQVVTCQAGPEMLPRMRAFAETIRDTSDCAIGYESAQAFLDGMDAFADEYESHVAAHACRAGISQKVPCEAMCPAHVDVPAYLAMVAEGDCAGAVAMVRKDNPFVTACALVCEHPCELRCRRNLIDAPLNIRGIKKYAIEHAPADKVPVPARNADTGRRVAVVGGGAAGLTCAYYLSLMGHRVDVFEARAHLGGMMRYGIPAYRLPRERLDEDVRGILAAGGIEVHLNSPVGTAEMMGLSRDFDAVFVSVGAQGGKTLRLEHIDAPGVSSAVEVLGRIGDGDYPDYRGKKVAVIGGGNVAMDCARTAVRAGADEVTVVYRRRREDMTALPSEVESAVAEGVEMLMLASPAGIEVDETGHACAVITQPQMIGPVKRGRPAPLDAAKPRGRVPADVVLVAVGQDVVGAPFEEFGMQTNRGCFVADEHLRAPGLPNVFVGGDCQTGPVTVIMAVGAGRVAARNIDEFLGYHHKVACDVVAPPARPNNPTPTGRVNIEERPARERRLDFAEVEQPMSTEEVLQECGRCLRCDHFGCGALVGGRIRFE